MKFFPEPLVHFLLLGSGLFFLSSLLKAPEGGGNKRIVVFDGHIEHLVRVFLHLAAAVHVDDLQR
jgi:hypothetical protein